MKFKLGQKIIYKLRNKKQNENKMLLEYFLNTGLVVPARIETSKKIDNKVFLDAIAGARAIQVDKDYRKTIDKMNKQFYSSME